MQAYRDRQTNKLDGYTGRLGRSITSKFSYFADHHQVNNSLLTFERVPLSDDNCKRESLCVDLHRPEVSRSPIPRPRLEIRARVTDLCLGLGIRI